MKTACKMFFIISFVFIAFTSKAFSISLLISPENQTVAKDGDIFSVKILIAEHNIPGDILGLDFRLIYDPSYLKLVDKNGIETLTVQSSILWRGGFVPSVNATNGIIEYSGTNIVSINCAGQGIQSSYPITAAEISFKALKRGRTTLKFDTTINPIEIINSPTLVYLYSVEPHCAGATIPLANTARITIGDFTPPVINNIIVSKTTLNSAVIKWVTDEPSSSQVEYGTSLSYGNMSTLNSNLETTHTVTLQSLMPQTAYHFRVKSTDSAGNESISNDSTFTTITSLFSVKPQIQKNPSRNGSTVFHYSTSRSVTRILFEIFTLSGKRVEAFEGSLSGETKWNWGNDIASGVYFYRVSVYAADNSAESVAGKIVILK